MGQGASGSGPVRQILAVLALGFFAPLVLGQGERDEDEVVFASPSDPDMVAAIQKARSTLDDFLSIAANPPAGTSDFQLKVMIKDAAGTEHFWVTPFRVIGSGFEGRLANEPQVVSTVQAGQIIRFSRAEVSDWGYAKNGKRVGSFTVCALFKKMPKEQVDYYRKKHGFTC